jgi:hypothetical protein
VGAEGEEEGKRNRVRRGRRKEKRRGMEKETWEKKKREMRSKDRILQGKT